MYIYIYAIYIYICIYIYIIVYKSTSWGETGSGSNSVLSRHCLSILNMPRLLSQV